MTSITRNDGTIFVTPSYREILSAKKKSLLKKEIRMLSENYGEFLFIRKKMLRNMKWHSRKKLVIHSAKPSGVILKNHQI